MLTSYSLFASFTYEGKLYDFDDIIVGDCTIVMDSKLAEQKEVVIERLSYLNQSFENIKLRLFTKNGIGGNLYIMKKRDYQKSFILNTDKNYRVIELSFYHIDQTLDCKVSYEK